MAGNTEKRQASDNLRRMTALSFLSALIAVLSVVGNYLKIPIGPLTVPITLTLCPIIIGGALYGPLAGAFLGFVFGLVTFITGMLGMDGGFVYMLFTQNPFGLIIMCFGKAILAGWVSAIVFKAVEDKSLKAASVSAGIVCPVVNTGFFIATMFLFFFGLVSGGATDVGKNILNYVITAFVGINFLIELVINLVLSSAVTLIIKGRKK